MFNSSQEEGGSYESVEGEEEEKISQDELNNIFVRTQEDLMGSVIDFQEIGMPRESLFGFHFLGPDIFDGKLEQIQNELFQDPKFIENKKEEARRIQGEKDAWLRQQKAMEEELRAKEAETRASAFQFDFGYLDAEVHDLLTQLESVYPNIDPLPNTSSTKSIYSVTKANVEKLGLKIVLNRLCLIGRFAVPKKDPKKTDEDIDADDNSSESVGKLFVEELRRIRLRADGVFAKELGAITGCLVCYSDYFVVMFEGPEISIMDILHQGRHLFENSVAQGSVLFVAAHVMVRYLQSWIELVTTPPTGREHIKTGGNVDTARENLVILSDSCQRLWRLVAKAHRSGLNPLDYVVTDMLPDERLIEFSMNCGLLRSLHVWLRRTITLTFGDFTSETWPQIFYPSVVNAHKSDSQFDSLGVLETYEDMPGIDQGLEEFLNTRVAWKPKDTTLEDLEGISKTLRDKLVKQGSILSVLSAVSKDTAYQAV